MGFFTSKKNDNPDISFMDTDRSVVQVIRSRFYGKSKGKEREVISSPVISSPRSPGPHRFGEKLVPLAGKTQGLLKKSPPPTTHNSTKSLPQKSPPQPATDLMTQTLAQRLNELAVSNSEGLLNDDEYRLLRQNLFERFAGGAVVPSETPLVPLASASHRSANGRSSVSSSTQGRPSSQFHVNRSPSLRKKTSMSSTVSTVFRRASRRQSSSGLGTNGTGAQSSAASDASSLFSMNSSSSFRRPVLARALSRKDSNSSIRTQTSRTAYNNSFSSRPGSSTLDPHSFTTPSTSRSTTRSLRRLATATPPSSFTARISGSELGPGEKPVSPTSVYDVFDDQNLRTAKEIRQEIELVEAEGRRLMDAFNGLELSTLTRCRQQPLRLPPLTSPSSDGSRSREGEGPTWSLIPERKRRGADVDALSIRSNTSAGTTLSAAKSQISGARIRTIPGTNKSISLLRKNSLSSLSSRANSSHGLHPVPPLPLSPSSNQSHLGVGSTSSINLSRSSGHLPLSALAESEIADRRSFTDARSGLGSGQTDQTDDADIIALEAELADIRKRRGEVTARYETRLEYLRAKLKGAELHEKLLRK